MRAFFVGGPTDNSELDMIGDAPTHYPPDTGSGLHRYRLHRTAERGGRVLYAVYAPPEMADGEIERVIAERNYDGRFPG